MANDLGIGIDGNTVAAITEYTENMIDPYVDALVWATGVDVDTPLGDGGTEQVTRDLLAFAAHVWPIISKYEPQDVAHDLWLTRNRHGAGFWDARDKPWTEGEGKILTEAANALGEQDTYIGDDGLLYIV